MELNFTNAFKEDALDIDADKLEAVGASIQFQLSDL